MHIRDLLLLRKIHSFFGIGTIYEREDRNMVYYSVQSARAITNIIIPHFDKYPLITQKKADYLLFKQIVMLMEQGDHLKVEGIQAIINIRASMNLGLSSLQKSKFINYNPVPRPIINNTEIPNLYWIAGFASGEGCFLVSISKSNSNKKGQIIQLTFNISQHCRDKKLLEMIAKYMKCGSVYSHSENASVFKVGKFVDINNLIIPIFKAHSIQGVKQFDFQDFCEIATLIGEVKHLSPEGYSKIKLIKDRMNTKRKYPKI